MYSLYLVNGLVLHIDVWAYFRHILEVRISSQVISKDWFAPKNTESTSSPEKYA